MTSSDFETDQMCPVAAWCDAAFVYATLADDRQIRAPLWWYPFLREASVEDRSVLELEFSGVWWPRLDEGISIKAMLLGWRAPGAVSPDRPGLAA